MLLLRESDCRVCRDPVGRPFCLDFGPLRRQAPASARMRTHIGDPANCGGSRRYLGCVEVYQVAGSGLRRWPVEDLEAVLDKHDGFVWVDVPVCETADAERLRRVFGFHELAVHDCLVRNHVAKIHSYDDHVFTVLHAPEIGKRGHVHYIELDKFMGPKYLVTVHGPLNPTVDPTVARIDTDHVRARLQSQAFQPQSPFELSAAIIPAMTRREIDMIAALAERSGKLEQQVVVAGDIGQSAEDFLNELFRVWYELLAIRTIAVHSSATYDRMARMARFLPNQVKPIVADLADGFDMVASMADGHREFLHGVIEYFQTRVSTHLTISADDMA